MELCRHMMIDLFIGFYVGNSNDKLFRSYICCIKTEILDILGILRLSIMYTLSRLYLLLT